MKVPQLSSWLLVQTVTFATFAHAARAQCDEWSTQFAGAAGTNGQIRALTVFDDATLGAETLVAGGTFTTAGGQAANCIARWDGSQWSTFASGVANGTSTWVDAITVYDSGLGAGAELYVGGHISSMGSRSFLKRWTGASWSDATNVDWSDADPDGVVAEIQAFQVFDDGTGLSLFVGGIFDFAGTPSILVRNIAKWNGVSWTALGGGMNLYSEVRALAVYDDGSGSGPALYAAGWIDEAGGIDINSVAKWNGTSWSNVGGGVVSFTFEGVVNALTVFDDGSGGGPALYATGNFDHAGGVAVGNIARWNGTAWSALGTGLNGMGNALQVIDVGNGPALYAGGEFTTAGGVSANRVAKWNGSSWSALGAGVNSFVLALAGYDDGVGESTDLFAGGSFSQAGGPASQRIAQWFGCGPGHPYCFGDGADPVVTAQCPCGNFGDPGRGCANSNGSLGGGHLTASGTTTPNTVLLTCDGIPNGALATFMRGPNHNVGGAVFGDGIKCLTSPLFRFGSQNAGTIGNPPNTVGVGAPNEVPGSTVHYFVQYRNSVPGFCAPETFNASNGYTISW